MVECPRASCTSAKSAPFCNNQEAKVCRREWTVPRPWAATMSSLFNPTASIARKIALQDDPRAPPVRPALSFLDVLMKSITLQSALDIASVRLLACVAFWFRYDRLRFIFEQARCLAEMPVAGVDLVMLHSSIRQVRSGAK